MSEQVAQVTAVFDQVAEDYDQSGVDFFQPIAERLTSALHVQAGERAVDVGCGRGAVTLRLAAAVGDSGQVSAVDAAPSMVALTREAAERASLGNISVEVMDATAMRLPQGSFDVLASSLVLFFLPEPEAALGDWLRLLRPGGRAGITTFGDQDETWRKIDALFKPYLPQQMLDARTSGSNGPFASDAAMEELMRSAGADEARTVRQDLPVQFADAEHWRAFSMSTGQRAMWRFVPDDEQPALFAAAAALLDQIRDASGAIVLHQVVRHTLGSRPA